MKRDEWLLLFLDLPLTEARHVRVVDPLRIQKGLFYFAQEQGKHLSQDALYNFEPYLYGPCSFDIYKDLDSLIQRGLATKLLIQGQDWPYYGLTDQGRQLARQLAGKADGARLKALGEIRTRVMSLPFLELLRKVYREHKRYAVNSIIKV